MTHTAENLDITTTLFRDAADKAPSDSGLKGFSIDGNILTVTNREGHVFTVNLESGINSVIEKCTDGGVSLIADLELLHTLSQGEAEAGEPQTEQGQDANELHSGSTDEAQEDAEPAKKAKGKKAKAA